MMSDQDNLARKTGDLNYSNSGLVKAIKSLPQEFYPYAQFLMAMLFGGNIPDLDEMANADDTEFENNGELIIFEDPCSIFGQLNILVQTFNNHTATLNKDMELRKLEILLSSDNLKPEEKVAILKGIKEEVLGKKSTNQSTYKNDPFEFPKFSQVTGVKSTDVSSLTR